MRGVRLPVLIPTVLLLHPSAGGYGADRQLEALATGLDPSRFRPLVVLGEDGTLVRRLRAGGIETHVRPLAVLARRLASARGIGALATRRARDGAAIGALARDREVAIVHTNTSIVISGQAVARRCGAAHLQHVRELLNEGVGPVTGLMWPAYRRHLLHADEVVCVSRAVEAQFEGRGTTSVVHDGVTRAPGRAPRDQARASLGLDPDCFVIAMVARISDWKGQDILARALAEPPLADIGAVGLIVGEAARGQHRHEADLRILGERLGLGNRLRLLGFREDLDPVFGAADTTVALATRPDAFPNAILEGAFAGVPTVAVNEGGLPEMVTEGRTGRLVAPRNPAHLATVLRELADDPAQRSELGAAAASDARSRFALPTMLDLIQGRYERLLADR